LLADYSVLFNFVSIASGKNSFLRKAWKGDAPPRTRHRRGFNQHRKRLRLAALLYIPGILMVRMAEKVTDINRGLTRPVLGFTFWEARAEIELVLGSRMFRASGWRSGCLWFEIRGEFGQGQRSTVRWRLFL